MRIVFLVAALVFLSGCATMNYSSGRPASEVAECIAGGWRKSPRSGYEAPVSLTRLEDYYFVGVELHPSFLPFGGLGGGERVAPRVDDQISPGIPVYT